MRGIQGPSSEAPVGGMYGPVKRAVEQATKRGAFVLPGGEGAISAENDFSYRSGYIPLNDGLKASLDSMFEAYRHGDHSEDLMYWLIAGHVATGQMKTAREIVGHARRLGIEDSRIGILDAIISYAFGDHERSESMLRGLLRENPLDCIALINLAVVLMQNDDRSEATEMLQKVIDSCDDSALVTRARTLLNQN